MDVPIADTRLRFRERGRCPACGGLGRRRFAAPFAQGPVFDFIARYYEGRIAAADLGDATYAIAACTRCGLHYQEGVLDDAGMERLYEHVISPEASLAKRETAGSAYFTGLVRDAGRIAGRLPATHARDIRVLDFGMGWGHWAAAAKALGHTVSGVEISPRRIAFARSLGVEAVDPAALADASFDYIHADQVFEHLAEPAEVLAGLVRLLRPDGLVRIAVPDGRDTAARLAAGWTVGKNELHPLEHLNSFTDAALDAMAERAGLLREGEGWRRRLRRRLPGGRGGVGGLYRKPA